MAAGVLVLLLPRFAPYVVAGWLGAIVTNMVIISAARGGQGPRHSCLAGYVRVCGSA